jgi:diaminopimelate decarboxylase
VTLGATTRATLARVAREHGTPCYVYFVDDVRARLARLADVFGGRFSVSYAVKANPNPGLLACLAERVVTFDVSSIGEAERCLEIGWPAARLTFSGPAKREAELERAVEIRVGELVCESEWELATIERLAARAGARMRCLLRINPARAPRKFGVAMSGKPSQFGIDEEDLPEVLRRWAWPHVDLAGFHVYAGSNSLSAPALAENFEIFIELFARFAALGEVTPRTLVFGSGFGIPYTPDDEPLDLEALAALVNPRIDDMRRTHPRLAGVACVLEMGRWLVGPAGYLLTTVIGEKRSRGTEIRLCDAGFNAHLAAFGMLGTVIRRNWPMWKVTGTEAAPMAEYQLVGPLCTSIDVLATRIRLPELHRDDVIAIGSSGAYGLTASPTRFIHHPEPREYLVVGTTAGADIVDVTEPGARRLPGK